MLRCLTVLLAIACHLLSACRSLAPKMSGVSGDSNGVTEYWHPTFENHTTWFGWTFVGATAAAGAWKGYTSNLALRWQGWERRSEVQPIGNATLGALAGMASGLLLTLITGGGSEIVTTDNAERWLDKLDGRLMLIPTGSHPGMELTSIRAIAQDADATYTIRTMADVRLFLAVFSGSPFRDRVLTAAATSLRHDSLLEFAELAHGFPAEREAIERYLAEATSLSEAIALTPRFVTHRPTIEQRSADLVTTFAGLRQFQQVFPESRLTDGIAQRLRDRLQRDEIPEFIRMFPLLEDQRALKLRYLRSFGTTVEVIDAARLYPELRSEADHIAAELAHSIDEFRAYLTAYPEGTSAGEIRQRLRRALHASERDENTEDADVSETSDDDN